MEPNGYTAPHTAPPDAVFAALADPTRRSILARLRDGEATVTELATPSPTEIVLRRAFAAPREHDGVTTLTSTVHYPSRHARDTALRYPMEQGVGESYAALDDVLAELTAGAAG
jgi:hypothetical protein